MSDDTKFSILVVDDESCNIDVLNHILRNEYRIYVAKSGHVALTRARQDKPDLILLDVVMPDMSGFDVLVELKESDATREIPVIFITGLASVQDEEKGFYLGAVDYITKPFNNSIVKARVKTHLQTVRQIRTIERLCMIDALTNISNRRSFDQRIHAEWENAHRDGMPLSILMMDVDHFKQYNDLHGHPQGDILLQVLAKKVSLVLARPTDAVFRVGGEEFAVLLPQTSVDEAVKVAETIRATIEATKIPSTSNSPETSTTVSVGVATAIPSSDMTIADLVKLSDTALYTAKGGGRNRISLA